MTAKKLPIGAATKKMLISGTVALLVLFCKTARAEEGQACYAYSIACIFPFDGTNYETCGVFGTNVLTCEIGTRDPAPSCCYEGNASQPETGVKCAATQLTTTATTVYYQGISALNENGNCHCTDLEQQARSGTQTVTVATFDSTGCSASPYE